MATTWTTKRAQVVGMRYDTPPLRNELHFEEATQTFQVGELIRLDATSKEVEIYNNGDTDYDLRGMSVIPAAGVVGTLQPFIEIDQNTLVEFTFLNGASDLVFAQTHLAGAYGVTVASNIWTLDLSKTGAAARFRIMHLSGMCAIGDTNVRVVCLPIITHLANP